jgi:hypothetical protein
MRSTWFESELGNTDYVDEVKETMEILLVEVSAQYFLENNFFQIIISIND